MVIKKMYKKRSQKVGVLFELKKIIQKKILKIVNFCSIALQIERMSKNLVVLIKLEVLMHWSTLHGWLLVDGGVCV